MWIIRWVVMALIIITVLTFSIQNQDQMVNLKMLSWQSGEIPLYVALFVSFGIGMVAFLVLAVFQQLQTMSDLARERKEHKQTKSELENARIENDNLRGSLSERTQQRDELKYQLEAIEKNTDTIEATEPEDTSASNTSLQTDI